MTSCFEILIVFQKCQFSPLNIFSRKWHFWGNLLGGNFTSLIQCGQH